MGIKRCVLSVHSVMAKQNCSWYKINLISLDQYIFLIKVELTGSN